MYPGDAQSKWPQKLLVDSRVLHYWDPQRVLGTSYLSRLVSMLNRRAVATHEPSDDAMWDAYYVYGPEDAWQDPVPMPIVWGYPILVTRETLVQEIEAIEGR